MKQKNKYYNYVENPFEYQKNIKAKNRKKIKEGIAIFSKEGKPWHKQALSRIVGLNIHTVSKHLREMEEENV